jgi:hypothetical protein
MPLNLKMTWPFAGRNTGAAGSVLAQKERREARWLAFCLLFVLVRGTLQVAVMPPWQHYDEPTHFEYSWLIADRRALPRPGDYDQAMRRQVAASMLEHGFFAGLDHRPDLLAQDEPIWLGLSELEHPPLYYLLAAPPLRLTRHQGVLFQLYAARLISVLLLALSVWIAHRLVAELVAPGHPLRWAVPASMAFLPAYLDLMTAVNNDVGAVVVFSLFLWGAVRTIRRGPSLFRLIWVVGATALCLWTKNTAMVALPLLPLCLALTFVRRCRQRWVWVAGGSAALLLVGALFSWGSAALWIPDTAQEVSSRQRAALAPLGEYALRVRATADDPGQLLRQLLPDDDLEALRGQTVTLGAWVWASESAQVHSPAIRDGHHQAQQTLRVDTAPTFHAITATVADNAEWIEVRLQPRPRDVRSDAVDVYFDGLVLVEGARPVDEVPRFDDANGRSGAWGSAPFVNCVRNGSAEAAWPRVRPWADEALFKYTHRPPMQFVASVLDWQRTGWVYGRTARDIFQTFWARFGWGQVGLPDGWYWVLGIGTGLGVLGALVGWIRVWRARPPRKVKRMLGFLAIATVLVWGNAFFRAHPVLLHPFLSSGRYVYPAVVPTMLALVAGWLAWLPRRLKRPAALVLVFGLTVLDAVSLLTVTTAYYGG